MVLVSDMMDVHNTFPYFLTTRYTVDVGTLYLHIGIGMRERVRGISGAKMEKAQWMAKQGTDGSTTVAQQACRHV